MAIDDLPLPVVNLLNVVGVPWPYIDEGAVSQFATFVREFGRAVQTTHDDATRAAAAGPADEIFLDSDALAQHVGVLRSQAAAMRGHGATFAGLGF